MNFEIASQLDNAVVPLAIALYIVGIFLKATPIVPSWLIPWILLILSILSAVLLLGCNISSTIQGVIASGIAVLGEQLYTQAKIGIKQTKEHPDNK